MACRKNVSSLTAQERQDLVTAIKALKANGKYNQYVRDHQAAMDLATPASVPASTRNAAHRGPAFLPWHREFLRRFEADLQAEVPGVSLPYWDWATDSALADPSTAPVWGIELMGGDGDSADSDIVKTGPFAFDAADPASSWTIADENGNDTGNGLQRAFAQSTPTLPTQAHVNTIQAITPYDSSPWDRFSAGYRSANEGWVSVDGQAAPNTHNRVHVWVGGSMLPGTSPNDPVFFLHHCFVDKLWADWQAAHPGEAFVPGPGESADLDGHRLNDSMYPWSTTVADVLDHRALGYVYDTDAPQVTQETASLVFNDVPEGQTTVRAAVFSISACGNLTFEVVSGPDVVSGPAGTSFSTPLGTTVNVDADATDKARVWIGFTGTSAGDVASGTVTIECVETSEQWVIPISANTIAKPTVATVLVLDQSGSMNSDAGDGRQRIDVLKEAAPVFVDLLGDDDGIGVVRFDQDAHPGTPIAVAGPMPFGAGRTAAKSAISSHVPNPAGTTSIGDGIDMAHADLGALPANSYDETAIVVLTDGRENAPQFISDVAGIIDDRVFGIGLGTAEQINPTALTALTNGTGGYVLMTGTLDTDDYFILQKYFLQILAGVTNVDVVLDPDGWVAPGAKIRIPFKLNEADITTDVILLTGDAPPSVFRFLVETPSGAIITPGTAAATPGIEFSAGQNALIYRITLPVPVAGFEEREGTWHSLLELDPKGFRKYLSSLDNYPEKLLQARAHGLRYSLVVHSSSNLRMTARLDQSSMVPGANLTVRARLTQFGLPVTARSTVEVELERPDGSKAVLVMPEVEPGVFEVVSGAPMAGVYSARVLAEGTSLRNRPFTREQLLSAAVWIGGDQPPPRGGGDGGSDRDGKLCKLLLCLFTNESIQRFLKKHEIDVDGVIACIKRCCEHAANNDVREVLRQEPEIVAAIGRILSDPDMRRALKRISDTTA